MVGTGFGPAMECQVCPGPSLPLPELNASSLPPAALPNLSLGPSSTFPLVPNLDHQEDSGQQVTELSEKIVLAYSCDKWQSHHIVPNFSVPVLGTC